MPSQQLHVGLIGAGIGGLATAIALRRAGATVTVLEAASELGEIGAGIQMTPNVARLLRKWHVSDVIGDNLVQIEELNLRRYTGSKVGYTRIALVESTLEQPWWLVHRAHLHEGLVTVARREGATILTDARVESIDLTSEQVKVITAKGKKYTFDLCVGSDGLNSIVRKTLFPNVKPEPPTTNCAYRAIVPMEMVRNDPVTRELVDRSSMEVWMGPQAYIITYPISAGKDFNMVMSHHKPDKLRGIEVDVSVAEMQEYYKDFDPRIRRVLEMIPKVSRWPLMVTPPLPAWSSPTSPVVLIGDAAHSMVNHMAQGAATSMEDGAFLARCIARVIDSRISLRQAISIYEDNRMPKAYAKQQVSYLNGEVWQFPDGPQQKARDEAMKPELAEKPIIRSPNLYGDPQTVLEVYGYDAEEHAEREVARFCGGGGDEGRYGVDKETGVADVFRRKYVDWFLPSSLQQQGGKIADLSQRGTASKL